MTLQGRNIGKQGVKIMTEERKEQLWRLIHTYCLVESGQPNVSSSNEALDVCLSMVSLASEGAIEFRKDAMEELI